MGQDAAVCVIGPGGIRQGYPKTIVDAAHAAGVKRLIIDDFGWGPDVRGLAEFAQVHAERKAQWDYAKAKAEEDDTAAFTWTGITSGNPIDWVSDDIISSVAPSHTCFRPCQVLNLTFPLQGPQEIPDYGIRHREQDGHRLRRRPRGIHGDHTRRHRPKRGRCVSTP